MNDPTSLVAWQVADQLSRALFRISTLGWTPASGPAWEQARRAALSVSLNIVEGYAWRPGGRWKYHLRVANGSALETIFVIRFLSEIGALNERDSEELLALASRSKRLVWGLLKGATRGRDN